MNNRLHLSRSFVWYITSIYLIWRDIYTWRLCWKIWKPNSIPKSWCNRLSSTSISSWNESKKKTRTPKHRNVESRIFSIFFLFISCEIQSIAIETLENFYYSLAIQKYLSSEQKRGEKNGEIVESCCRSVESKTLGHCGNMLISKTVAHRISVRFHVKNVCSLISDLTQNSTHMQIEFFLFTFFSRNIFWGSIFLH